MGNGVAGLRRRSCLSRSMAVLVSCKHGHPKAVISGILDTSLNKACHRVARADADKSDGTLVSADNLRILRFSCIYWRCHLGTENILQFSTGEKLLQEGDESRVQMSKWFRSVTVSVCSPGWSGKLNEDPQGWSVDGNMSQIFWPSNSFGLRILSGVGSSASCRTSMPMITLFPENNGQRNNMFDFPIWRSFRNCLSESLLLSR